MTTQLTQTAPVPQPTSKSGTGVVLLWLGTTAAVVQSGLAGTHWFKVSASDHAGVWAPLLISTLLIAGVGALVWSTGLALLAIAGGQYGKHDAAVEVMRAARLAFYVALMTTFASLSIWTNTSAGYIAWLIEMVVVLGLPLAGLIYFARAKSIRARFGNEFANRMGEAGLKMVSRDAAIMVLLMLISLVSVLTIFSVPSIKAFGWQFVVGKEWRANPLPGPAVRDAKGDIVYDDDGNQVMTEIPPVFGALPVIFGTTVSSVIALVFAVPLSFGAALFLVRIAARWLVTPVSFLIEFLAAIPSIAYGIWGLFVMCPFLQRIEPYFNHLFIATPGLHWLASPTGGVTGRDMLAGGLILGVMVVPIITAISRDVLRNVPVAQLEGTVALGATWWESSKEMLKYSRAGLFGAVMLGLARAAGETMAITMVIGNNTQIKSSLFAPAQTMSSLLANEFAEAGGDMQRSALTEVALILLVMSLLFNIVARYLVVGKQSRSAAAA